MCCSKWAGEGLIVVTSQWITSKSIGSATYAFAQNESFLFRLTKVPTFLEKNRQKRDKILLEKSKRENKFTLKDRELTMKYFGDYPKEMKERNQLTILHKRSF